jgi:hypothetical protein
MLHGAVPDTACVCIQAKKIAAKKAPRPKAKAAKKATVKTQVAAEPATAITQG